MRLILPRFIIACLFIVQGLFATMTDRASAQPDQVEATEEERSYKPRIVYQPPAVYPAPAVGSRVVGEVVLRFLVDAEGQLEDVQVQSAEPRMI